MLDVYWVPVPPEATVDQVAGKVAILDPEEQETYSRYRVDFKKVEFMTGRLLLKTLLAERLGTAPKSIRFTKNRYGRPYLYAPDRQPSIFFNLSHTQGVVACVLSPWARTGIDVERVEEEHLEVMPTVFVPAEIDFINARPTMDEKLRAFGLLWTRKEAVMKAEGMGFHMPPRSFTVPHQWDRASDALYVYHAYEFEDLLICSLAQAKGEGVSDSAPRIHRVDFSALFGL